jgi:hypothetical protein
MEGFILMQRANSVNFIGGLEAFRSLESPGGRAEFLASLLAFLQ